MSGTTQRHGLPYPTAGDPVYRGAEQVQALAEAVDAKLGTAGGGTATGVTEPTPNTLVQRDAGGRSKFGAPVAGADAATRGWVEGLDYATRTDLRTAIEEAEIGGGDGSGGGEGSSTPEAVTALPDTLVKRDAAGRTKVSDPSVAADAANKGYVDNKVTQAGYITAEALQPYATRTWVTDQIDDLDVTLPADVARQSDLQTMRTEMFGGPNRTHAPFCEVRMTSNRLVGKSDTTLGSNWTAQVDTDNGWTRTTSLGYYTIPVAGRYVINMQLVPAADNAAQGGAIKVLLNGTNVHSNTIASRTGTPSLEGPAMRLSTDYLFNAGDKVYLSCWHSGNVTLTPVGFGQCRTKCSFRYVGSK